MWQFLSPRGQPKEEELKSQSDYDSNNLINLGDLSARSLDNNTKASGSLQYDVRKQWMNLIHKTGVYLVNTKCLSVKNQKIYFVSFDCRAVTRPPYEFSANRMNWFLSNYPMEGFDPDIVIIGLYNINLCAEDQNCTKPEESKTKNQWRQFFHDRVKRELKNTSYKFINTSQSMPHHSNNAMTPNDPSSVCDILVYLKETGADRQTANIMNVGATSYVAYDVACYAVRFDYEYTAFAICCIRNMLDPMDLLEEFYDLEDIHLAYKTENIARVKAYRAKLLEMSAIRVHQRQQLIRIIKGLKWETFHKNQTNNTTYVKRFRWEDHPFQLFCGVRDLRNMGIRDYCKFEADYIGLDKEVSKISHLHHDRANPIKEKMKMIQALDVHYSKETQMKRLMDRFGVPDHIKYKDSALEAFPGGTSHVHAISKDLFLGSSKYALDGSISGRGTDSGLRKKKTPAHADMNRHVAVEAVYINANCLCYRPDPDNFLAKIESKMRLHLSQNALPSSLTSGPESITVDAPVEINFGTLSFGERGEDVLIKLKNNLSECNGIPLGFMFYVYNAKTGTTQTVDLMSKHSTNPRRNVVETPMHMQNNVSEIPQAQPTTRLKSNKNPMLKELGKGLKGAPRFMRGKNKKSKTLNLDLTKAKEVALEAVRSEEEETVNQEDMIDTNRSEQVESDITPVLEETPRTAIEEQSINLGEFLIVEPSFGTILPGQEQEVAISIKIDCPIRFPHNILAPDEVHLILRCKESCKDQILIIKVDGYSPGLNGMDVMDYHKLEHIKPISSVTEKSIEGWSLQCKKLTDEFAAEENRQIRMSIITQCKPEEKLPVPKELWWLLDHAFSNLQQDAIDLNLGIAEPVKFNRKTDTMDGSNFNYYSNKALPFILSHFLEYCSLPIHKHSVRFAQEIKTAQFCLEHGYKIPKACSVYATLHVLKEWCTNLPTKLICEPNLVSWIDCDDLHRHDLCNAFLWALPPFKRNILVLILSLCRELLSHPKQRRSMWMQRWFREFEEHYGFDPLEHSNDENATSVATNRGGDSPKHDNKFKEEDFILPGTSHLTEEQKQFSVGGVLLYDPFEEDYECWISTIMFYTHAMADWIVSFAVEGVTDSQDIARKGHTIVSHFLVTPEYNYMTLYKDCDYELFKMKGSFSHRTS